MTQPPDNILSEWALWGLTQPPKAIEAVHGGLTNANFLIECDSGQLLLRLNNNGQSLGIERTAELKVHTLLSQHGLSPTIRYTAPDHRYWVREYVQGRPLSQGEITDRDMKDIATTLKQIHQLPAPEGTPRLDVKASCLTYLNAIDNRSNKFDSQLAIELTTLRTAVDKIQPLPESEACLCHMDPLPANWVRDNTGKLWLLDLEYACVAHPSLDFAALALQLPDAARKAWTALLPESIRGHMEIASEQIALLDRTWRLAHTAEKDPSL